MDPEERLNKTQTPEYDHSQTISYPKGDYDDDYLLGGSSYACTY